MVTPLRYVKLLPVVLKLLPLQGALFATHKNPGRCPGLRASATTGRAAYMSFLALLGRVFKIYQFFDTFFASKYKLIHTKSTC